MKNSLNYRTTPSQRHTRYGRPTNKLLPTEKSSARPPKQAISSGNADPTTRSEYRAPRRRLVKRRPLNRADKAAQTCYNFLKHRLHCEDTLSPMPPAFQMPLPDFIRHILAARKVPRAVIETVMLLVYRYSVILKKQKIKPKSEAICGHLIFLGALITAADIHWESDAEEFKNRMGCYAKITTFTKKQLADIHRRFSLKIGNLGSASFLEQASLFYFKTFIDRTTKANGITPATQTRSLPATKQVLSLTITFQPSYTIQHKVT